MKEQKIYVGKHADQATFALNIMTAYQSEIKTLNVDASNGSKVYAKFKDGSEMEFGNLEAFAKYMNSHDRPSHFEAR